MKCSTAGARAATTASSRSPSTSARDVAAAIHGPHRFETGTADEHQLVITNRIVRRVIELARVEHAYHRKQRAMELDHHRVDARIDLTDAVRA